jgi:hypothetical protein
MSTNSLKKINVMLTVSSATQEIIVRSEYERLAALPRIKLSNPAALPPGRFWIQRERAIPAPKKQLRVRAIAESDLILDRDRIREMHQTLSSPEQIAPQNKGRKLLSLSRRKATQIPGSDACATQSPTRARSLSVVKEPIIPQANPSKAVPTRTVMVLKLVRWLTMLVLMSMRTVL